MGGLDVDFAPSQIPSAVTRRCQRIQQLWVDICGLKLLRPPYGNALTLFCALRGQLKVVSLGSIDRLDLRPKME